MIFVARRIDARVELTKPLDFCCNCGRDADIDLVETPLQRTRFFLVFGTELTVREEFPYCRGCRRSAGRVRPGTLSKLLMAALTTSILVLVIVVSESVLPDSLRTSPFWWSVALAVVASFGYFAFRARGGTPRSYYQPVRLADARMRDGHLQRLRLEFANQAYGGLFARANADLVAAGALEVR